MKSTLTILSIAMALSAQGQNVPGTYSTTWLGNSFGAYNSTTPKWVQDWVLSAAVASDGAMVGYGNWDEGGNNGSIYKNGDLIGVLFRCRDASDGLAAAIDTSRVILTSYSNARYGIRVWSRATLQPLTLGTLQGNTMLDISPSPLRGVAVTTNRIFVSDTDRNRVRAYNYTTYATAGTITITSPRHIAIAGDGTLWISQYVASSNRYNILHYSYNTSTNKGTQLGGTISLPAGVIVTGLAVDTSSATGSPNRLLIADNGTDQNIKVYTNLSGTPLLGTPIGVTGGVFAGPMTSRGQVGPMKFNGLAGLGVDSAGNLMVASNGGRTGPTEFDNHSGTIIESYSSAGLLNWQLSGLAFEDTADRDPLSDETLYTKDKRFGMDYGAPVGQGGTYAATTLNRFKYPSDPRLQIADNGNNNANTWMRRINGKPIVSVVDQISIYFQIFRFNPTVDGETAIPAVVFSKDGGGLSPNAPPNDPWMWRDTNGNGAMDSGEFTSLPGDNRYLWGWWIDDAGGVWKSMRDNGLRYFPSGGLDVNGVPNYSVASSVLQPLHNPFQTYHRVQYNTHSDRMYLSGWTTTYPQIGDSRDMGRVLARFSNWSTVGSNAAVQPDYQIVLTYSSPIVPQSFVQEGAYIFVVYYDAGTQTARYVEVYAEANGAFVGRMFPDGNVGQIMQDSDTPNNLQAWQRLSGEYVVSTGDYSRAKHLLFRWMPTGVVGPTIVDDTSPAITYTGYSAGPTGGRYGGGTKESNSAGATATFTFTGTMVGLIGEKADYAGEADVYIDNVFQGRVSFFKSGAQLLQQTIFSKSHLSPGSHTVRIVSVGNGWTYVDAIQYRN